MYSLINVSKYCKFFNFFQNRIPIQIWHLLIRETCLIKEICQMNLVGFSTCFGPELRIIMPPLKHIISNIFYFILFPNSLKQLLFRNNNCNKKVRGKLHLEVQDELKLHFCSYESFLKPFYNYSLTISELNSCSICLSFYLIKYI